MTCSSATWGVNNAGVAGVRNPIFAGVAKSSGNRVFADLYSVFKGVWGPCLKVCSPEGSWEGDGFRREVIPGRRDVEASVPLQLPFGTAVPSPRFHLPCPPFTLSRLLAAPHRFAPHSPHK